MKKFVIDNPEPFIVDFKFQNDPKGVADPLNTITAVNGYGLVVPTFVVLIGQQGFCGDKRQYSVNKPLTTVVVKAEQCLVAPTLVQYHGEKTAKEVRGQSLENPLLTTDTANRYGLLALFMSKYYSRGHQGCGNSANELLNTIAAIDHNAIIASHILKLKGKEIGQPAEKPLHTIMAEGTHFWEVRTFFMKYCGHSDAYKPIVTVQGERFFIADIGFRMLTPRELFNAQGFPQDYIIETGADGKPTTKALQVARCGNAVPPPFAEALVRANR